MFDVGRRKQLDDVRTCVRSESPDGVPDVERGPGQSVRYVEDAKMAR